MEDPADRVDDTKAERTVKVMRRKKRRKSSKSNKFWYESSRLRIFLEVGGKMVVILLAITVVGLCIWAVMASLQ